jgi:hypothetical protein
MDEQTVQPPPGYALDNGVKPPPGYALDDARFTAEATAKAPTTMERVGNALLHNPVTDAVGGIGSGVVSTGLGAYKLARRIPGADKVLPAPGATFEAAAQPPDSFAGRAGKFVEQGAEFLVPMGEIAKAVEGLPLVARLAAEALTAGGTAGLQTGGDGTAMVETALTTGLLGAAGAGGPAGVKALLRMVIPRLEAAGIPLSAGAEALAAKHGITLTAGMRTGSPALQSAEGTLGNTVAPDLYRPVMENARKGINAAAQDLSGGFATDKFGAGENLGRTMLSKAGAFKKLAEAEYANLAKVEADPANVREVQIGMKPNPAAQPTGSGLVDQFGNPAGRAALPGTIPDLQRIGLPVDMRPAKQLLAPEVADIQRFMTAAQKRSDPALSAIQNILSRPDHLAASVAEGDLSYLKEVLRSSDSTPQAKRLAGKAIDAMEPQVQQAVSMAGPWATASLNDARGAWQARSSILDQLGELSGDVTGKTGQVRLATRLLQPADASFPALQKVLVDAPEAAGDLGKAYLTERVFRGAAAGEDVSAKQASNLWNQIGARTKEALYSTEQVANINDFMSLAKRVAENPEVSKGGVMQALLKAGVFLAHPVAGPGGFLLGRNVAKVLYSPEGAAALRTAFESPGTAQGSKAMLVVKSILDESETAK